MSQTSPLIENVAKRFQLEWNGPQYAAVCRKATVEGVRKAVAIVKPAFRRLAPRSTKHRSKRTYPGGRVYLDEKRISQSVTSKVIDRKFGVVTGLVKSYVGYSGFVNYGRRIVARDGRLVGQIPGKYFAQRALIQNQDKVMAALKGEWPR